MVRVQQIKILSISIVGYERIWTNERILIDNCCCIESDSQLTTVRVESDSQQTTICIESDSQLTTVCMESDSQLS